MAKKDAAALSPAQLEIMNVVWDKGDATVGQVWEVLSAKRGLARNTVQTMISRLEEKGWLRRRRRGNVLVYRAATPRGATQKRLVERLVETAFHGSVEGLVMTLLDAQPLSPAEAERIRNIINQSAQGQAGKDDS